MINGSRLLETYVWDFCERSTLYTSQCYDRRHHNYHIITLIKFSLVFHQSAVIEINFLFVIRHREMTIRYRPFATVETLINYLLNSSYYSFSSRFREISHKDVSLLFMGRRLIANFNGLMTTTETFILWMGQGEVTGASSGELKSIQLMSLQRHLVFTYAKRSCIHLYSSLLNLKERFIENCLGL